MVIHCMDPWKPSPVLSACVLLPLSACAACPPPPGRAQAEGGPGAEAAIKARERQLAPVYHQVAIQFAQVGGLIELLLPLPPLLPPLRVVLSEIGGGGQNGSGVVAALHPLP